MTAFSTSATPVSIHVPLAEHDLLPFLRPALHFRFQFTCPSRSTTLDHLPVTRSAGFQFTCPSRSTTCLTGQWMLLLQVSIHVPLAEHDTFDGIDALMVASFNSRAPRGARQDLRGRFAALKSFNSRAPRGARQQSRSTSLTARSFQFTCPSRSTTTVCFVVSFNLLFQFTCPSRSTTASSSFSEHQNRKFQFTCPSRSTT